ncbi:MAG: tetratricopeptide repeat protein [Chthoniobacterales bacterium]
MKSVRFPLLPLLVGLFFAGNLLAQGDPAGEFFAAYQEFQRAERLEREGRTKDAAAKFRYVASQLGQIKSQNPEWQPMVVDFRLKKTQEALVRLEGAAAPATMGPPPDLAELPGEEDLPPVQPARVGAPPGPTISISPDAGPAETPAIIPDVPPTAAPIADDSSAESSTLRSQLAEEQNRTAELEQKLSDGQAEIARIAAELDQAKATVTRLEEESSKKSDDKAEPENAAEIQRLGKAAKELEETLAAATAEKEKLSAAAAESAKQIEDLNAQLTAAKQESDTAKSEAETAKTEAETAKKRTGELEAERETLVAERDGARQEVEKVKGEMTALSTRVTELENERTELVAARDTAQKEAAEAKTALEKNAELIEANKQLEQKLADAAQKISGMETDAAAKAELVEGLQKDLDKVRGELATAQTQLKDDRERFDKLQAVNDQLLKEYDRVTGALAAVQLGEVSAAEAKLLQQENEVLRGIIMRQIDEQARREQAYRLAQEEMQRLEIKSDTLNDKLNELAKPTLELSEAEQEMLKRPVVTLLDADAAKMSAQVAVLKPADNAPPPEGQSAEAQPSPSPSESPAEAAAAGEEATPATEAAAAAESLNTEISSELMALVNDAREQFVKGNFLKAEELYVKFLESQPDNVIALANLGVAQFRQGKLTAAQLALEKAVKVDPNDAFSLTTLGAVMIEQNRIQDAVGYLERANTSSPDDPITLNYLGVASSQLGEFGRAEQSLRRAITVKPEYAEAHFNLAVIYATAKPPSIALAKRHYEKALELGSSPDKRLATMLQGEPGR